MTAETWKAVRGFEGRYEVSDLGRVRSNLSNDGSGHFYRKPTFCGYGYPSVTFTRADGSKKSLSVHRVVMTAFVGPRPDGMVIRHLDGDVWNSRLDNLSYGTHAENAADKVRHGRNPQLNRTHCPAGHPYDAANTYVRSDLSRNCRACRSAYQRRRRALLRNSRKAQAAA